MNPLLLALGGARSGKSRFALDAAARYGPPRRFVATARALDEEMTARIGHHREARDAGWTTIEEPLAIAASIRDADAGVIVVDCLTLWLANLMGDAPDTVVDPWVDDLLDALGARRAAVILVSNEVGLGIVPGGRLARAFRDAAGRLNQRVAAVADEVHLLVAGQALRIR